MRTSSIYLALGLVLAAAPLGCSAKDEAEDGLEGVPEQAALQLDVTDDVESEGLATDADAIDAAGEASESLDRATAGLAEEVAPELQGARAAVRDLNQSLRAFLQPIVALVRNAAPTTDSGDVKTWGPITRGATELRFVLRHGAARHYGWLLQARPVASDGAFSNVAAGGITVGFRVRRGHGSVGLDLDALAAADPTAQGSGQIFAGFGQGPHGSMLSYGLRGFTPNTERHAPVDALLHGVHLAAGDNRLRLAYYGNVAGSASDAEELVLARVRHRRELGGRADVIATGGDIAAGKAWLVSECWGPGHASLYRVLRECTQEAALGEHCELVSEMGDESGCPRHVLEAELPPLDPQAAMDDPESPEDVSPPDTMPDGTPPAG